MFFLWERGKKSASSFQISSVPMSLLFPCGYKVDYWNIFVLFFSKVISGLFGNFEKCEITSMRVVESVEALVES